mmetsp:Transcript_10183/g.19073  ORF Transcript_10183/g.19073 Transcript_10183/m.19073 type:complete len:493 (+) Transcript_10183:324-1802(+)
MNAYPSSSIERKSCFEIQMRQQEETDTTTTRNNKEEKKKRIVLLYSCYSAVKAFLLDWFYTILIGALVVSFWRGTWLLLDLYLCQQSQTASLVNGETFCLQSNTRYQSAWISYLTGILLLSFSLVVYSKRIWYVPTSSHLTVPKSMKRVCLVYMFGMASVCVWRGIWYASDKVFWPNVPVLSYTVTMLLGLLGCFGMGCGASLLAPPSLFFMDGPGHSPPPIGLTILEAYYTVTLSRYTPMPLQTIWRRALDISTSYVVLPILVVWFWRGCWGLLDILLWGFTTERDDLHWSLVWGAILALVTLFLGSNDAFYLLPKMNNKTCLTQIIGRLKTVILALATVSFWRVIWYIWDEFLGNSKIWSAWLSHVVGVLGLLALGCFSCISASPTTVGVDALTHEDALEEPLFHGVPIPAESIHFMAISKNPGDLALSSSSSDNGEDIERVPSKRFYSSSIGVCSTNPTMVTCVCPDELYVSRRSLEKREHSIQFIRSR